MRGDAADVLAVIGVLNRYAWALDTRDWEGLCEVFAEDLRADYGAFTVTGVGDMVERMRESHAHVDSTQHLIGGHDVQVDGDVARSRCQVIATLRRAGRPSRIYRMGGWYADELVRTPAGWRIAVRTAHGLWQEGDRAVPRPPDVANS
ncbi:nuclear transport factor 2 family protein [Trujillonella endophytica]|uniref:SnoaL-like domain-containing protein n=1 Tax=Trujillonella endophytica TaxID=673521 RepID=A0A1H8VY28_9ACTN|nr:nuclear transport factor 2 family protein [Trujillella endophytica]SEP20301.1 SnoaL-like domain-containing protein [Trujillella endophytica]